jgi:hypothetical protein
MKSMQPTSVITDQTLEPQDPGCLAIRSACVALRPAPSTKSFPYSRYVNFVREEDAVKCIQAVDGAMLDGKLIRACFGTTKYCNSYLKHVVSPWQGRSYNLYVSRRTSLICYDSNS